MNTQEFLLYAGAFLIGMAIICLGAGYLLAKLEAEAEEYARQQEYKRIRAYREYNHKIDIRRLKNDKIKF